MPTTLDKNNTHEITSAAKAEFNRAKDRLVRNLETTPDDKINWSPSATARTPLQIVAHSALSISGMQGMLDGKPFPWESITEADKEWRKMEKEYKTRKEVLDLLEKNAVAYNQWLDEVTPEKLDSTFTVAFGSFPMTDAITFIADHLRNHCAQIDYIQTVYGDLDWHMG
jgi:hypothetical protein